MKKMLALVALLALMAMPSLVKAEENVDIAKIPCNGFLELAEDEMAGFIFWIDGYLSAKSGDTTMNDAYIERLGTHLGTFCGNNPNKTLMDAIKAYK